MKTAKKSVGKILRKCIYFNCHHFEKRNIEKRVKIFDSNLFFYSLIKHTSLRYQYCRILRFVVQCWLKMCKISNFWYFLIFSNCWNRGSTTDFLRCFSSSYVWYYSGNQPDNFSTSNIWDFKHFHFRDILKLFMIFSYFPCFFCWIAQKRSWDTLNQ